MNASPRYPVYVVSKGRAKPALTARSLRRDGVPFKIVVEPQEQAEYEAALGPEDILVLPFSNLGLGSIPARNWIWEHAKVAGYERHWILDDNIGGAWMRWKAFRIPCNWGLALCASENFIDRYENVGVAGLSYDMFTPDRATMPPFNVNVHVYSCMLVRNDLPFRWRGRYNEDTDLCLQTIAQGLCTVLINVFPVKKVRTMTQKGGNTTDLYLGDGRLKMARSLERAWPGIVKVRRRYGRPQHVVDWGRFKALLIRKAPDKMPKPTKIDVKLLRVTDTKSAELRAFLGLTEQPEMEGAA